MNFVIILEALKFYKSRSARTIQVWFVLLYGINILPFILPFVDLNFDAYAQALGDLMKGSLPDGGLTQIMTRGNWIFLGLMVLTSLISSFFTLMYAVGVVSETDAEQPQHILRRSLASLPRLLLFGLLMAVPAILSSCLAFIPLIVFGVMMYFLPLNLALDKLTLTEAMQRSFESTKQRRFFIFLQIVLLSLLISLPETLVESLVPGETLPYAFVSTFFVVLRALVQGRLMGILYLLIVKKVQFVLPSKTTD